MDIALYSQSYKCYWHYCCICSCNEVLSFAGTFRILLSTSEKELYLFVKNTYVAHSTRGNIQKILVSKSTVVALKAVLFEQKDCNTCNALQAINEAQIQVMRSQRTQAIHDMTKGKDTSLDTSVTIPKLMATNYKTFITAFTTLA